MISDISLRRLRGPGGGQMVKGVRGTWIIWSNIISIWVHFSTTFKLHKFIYITLVMSLYICIFSENLTKQIMFRKIRFAIEITIVNCVC